MIIVIAATQAFFKTHWKKIAVIGSGHGLWASISWIFDNVLYPLALAKFGYLWGGILMATLSCIICALTLVYYQRKGTDWVGAGVMDELRTSDTSKRHFVVRIITWALKKGDVFMFLFLTILKDPFMTTAYFTRGKFTGLNRRLWAIFGASVILANLYWIVRWSVIIEIIKAIF